MTLGCLAKRKNISENDIERSCCMLLVVGETKNDLNACEERSKSSCEQSGKTHLYAV